MNEIKIAFLLNGLLDPSNLTASLDVLTFEIAKRLAKHCHVVLYSKKGSHQKEFEYLQGVKYRRVSSSIDEKFDYLTSGLYNRLYRFHNFVTPPFASSLSSFMFALKIAKEIKSQKCDIIHIHQESQFVPIIRMVNPEIKIVLHMHCEWLTQLRRKMIENRIKDANLILGCSEFISEGIRHHFPKYSERCRTLYNGVDVDYFVSKNDREKSYEDGTKNLLFLGRVTPEKGLHVLLNSFKIVLKHYPQAQLKIVGKQISLSKQFFLALSDDPKVSSLESFYEGNYVSHLKNMLPSDVSSHVVFTGSVPREQLINFYRNADIFVFPPVWNEPFGIPVIDANAVGVPVVSTLSGGIIETVKNGETGLLVERGNASALAEAILRILSDEDLRKSMVTAARKRVVELFSWEKIVEDLLNYYKKLYED